MLKPAAKERRTTKKAPVETLSSKVELPPEQAEDAVPAPKRAKRAAMADAAESAPSPKRRGRSAKMAGTSEREPASLPTADLGTSQLRKKMEPPMATAEVAARPLGLGRWGRGEASHRPADERRPFRHVEVRKLGPGRSRNHRPSSGSAA